MTDPPFSPQEPLPESLEWMTIRCSERGEGEGLAHLCQIGSEVGLCGRRPWKASQYVEVLYRHPNKQCLVCVAKAREMVVAE